MRKLSKSISRRADVSYGWLRPWIESLCEAEPELRVRLRRKSEHNDHYLAVVNRAFAHTGQNWQCMNVAGLLTRQSRKEVLRSAWPDHPRGLLSALEKMGARLHARNYYDRVLKYLAAPASAKVLRHASFISPFMLKALDVLDPALHKPRLLDFLDRADRLHIFLYMYAVLEQVLSANHLREARIALSRVNTRSGLGDWFSRWLAKGSLPDAPWTGTDRLVPLATVAEIKQAAKQFRNCLAGEVLRVVACGCYFYDWRGREPAVVSVVTDPILGWVINNIKGQKNRTVSAGTRGAIIRDFARGSITWRPGIIYYPEDAAFQFSEEFD